MAHRCADVTCGRRSGAGATRPHVEAAVPGGAGTRAGAPRGQLAAGGARRQLAGHGAVPDRRRCRRARPRDRGGGDRRDGARRRARDRGVRHAPRAAARPHARRRLRRARRARRRGRFDARYRELRANLGRAILLGLEFLVAADIIGTVAIEPSFRSLGVLALIVAIRTFLSFSLELEISGRWPWQHADAEAWREAQGGRRDPPAPAA
jgi:hypothetical protein